MNHQYTVEELEEGLILPFDKPYGWTSFDLVNLVRKKLCQFAGIKKLKVGHAGTLDPLATGLLILCTGRATKKIISIQALAKEYEAHITLGATTPSFDLETEIDKTYSTDHINTSLLNEKINLFEGKIKQIPPLFSAKKINGKRAYEFARDGIEKKLEPVEVEIFGIEIISYDKPVLQLKVKCSSGTYIRSLARDIGKVLDSGAYLSGLKRTAIGHYNIKGAIDVEKFQNSINIL